MKRIETPLKDCFVFEPKVFGDERGFFLESFSQKVFDEMCGYHVEFVQDNHSRSSKGVLRGLHYQIQQAQGKLVRVTHGEVFDVAVDLRKSSPSFGKWFGVHLSEENKKQFWVPPGFAHGFIVLSESADFLYKTTNYYAPEHDRCVIWNDDTLGIDWGTSETPILSAKDTLGKRFVDADIFP